MKIGDIDITNSIVNLEYDMNVLQQILNHIFKNNSNIEAPTQKDVDKFKENAITMLNKKYPNMGIKKK